MKTDETATVGLRGRQAQCRFWVINLSVLKWGETLRRLPHSGAHAYQNQSVEQQLPRQPRQLRGQRRRSVNGGERHPVLSHENFHGAGNRARTNRGSEEALDAPQLWLYGLLEVLQVGIGQRRGCMSRPQARDHFRRTPPTVSRCKGDAAHCPPPQSRAAL